MARSYSNKIMQEEISEGLFGSYHLETIHFTGKSEIQEVEILTLTPYGLCLVIDGKIQSTEKDEFIYHECMVHPALSIHPNPNRVFICGGGEVATAREALRHNTVEKVHMVDIDTIVVDVSKKFLPKLHRGSFENPRIQLTISDARACRENNDGKYDVIIIDLSDPLEDGPAYKLFSIEFYELCKRRLNENGLIVAQSGPAGYTTSTTISMPVYASMKAVFKHPLTIRYHVPAFLDLYSFTIATDSDLVAHNFYNPEGIDAVLEARIDARHETGATEEDVGAKVLKAYDSESHRELASLPKWYRKFQAEANVTITDAAPRFYKAN